MSSAGSQRCLKCCKERRKKRTKKKKREKERTVAERVFSGGSSFARALIIHFRSCSNTRRRRESNEVVKVA